MIVKDGAKMSKSKGNTVSPDDLIRAYGADTVRFYTLFIGPPEKDAEWRDESVVGAYRFLRGLWDLSSTLIERLGGVQPARGVVEGLSPHAARLRHVVHRTIRKVTDDIEKRFHFNTALASLMELKNEMESAVREATFTNESDKGALLESLRTITLLLAPFAPHIAEEIWCALGEKPSIFKQSWPRPVPELLRENEYTVAIQVNGKVRGRISVPANAPDDEVRSRALEEENVKKYTEGKKIVKVVIVPRRLVNIVVR
jgi:leucyl-tRNA synthetase